MGKPTEEPTEMPAEPKKTDPLDPLPKGTFDLEDWKRFYSNNDEDKSCEYFWSKFDPSCYSIWRGDYNNNNTISSIWVFKGQELAFELSEDWQVDYSSYEWKKLDPAAPETRRMVDQYWKWEGVDKEGRKFNQGKIFK